ncbi:MAG: T9SS type A sorting domain-containing protein [Bacteroidales bacterium]
MKKISLLLIFFIRLIGVNAQGPTLTSANAGYAVGDLYNFEICDSITTAGNSGAGVVWDYSTLNTLGYIINQTCISPSGTPNASSFLTANVAIDDQTGYYYYYLSNSTELTMLGEDNFSYITVYSDPQKMFVFPFSYGLVFTDNFTATYTSSGIVHTKTGTSSSEGDGWGTLLLHGNTFNNVLRVKITQNYTDQSANGTISTYLQSYLWYDGIHKAPLLTFNEYLITCNGTSYTIIKVAINSDVVGIKEPGCPKISVSLYPNPAKDVLNIYSSAKIAGIKLFNVYGQLVLSSRVNSANTAINIVNLADGIYLFTDRNKRRHHYKECNYPQIN